MMDWISPQEYLPKMTEEIFPGLDVSEDVLLCTDTGKVIMGRLESDEGDRRWILIGPEGLEISSRIIAWAPIPELPDWL